MDCIHATTRGDMSSHFSVGIGGFGLLEFLTDHLEISFVCMHPAFGSKTCRGVRLVDMSSHLSDSCVR